MKEGHFVWHELSTPDPEAAARFYAAVVGWEIEPKPELHYIMLKAAGMPVTGIAALPQQLQDAGLPPRWVGYLGAADVDATAAAVQRSGGTLKYGPDDIPGVGRFAVLTDPDGLPFCLFAAGGEEMPEPLPMTSGHVGWNELLARDHEASLGFFAGLFGWERSRAIEMGPMGIYQLYAYGGQDRGGMMNAPEGVRPGWRFYFVVDGIDAAMGRVTAEGGQVVFGPQEVPGGAWVCNGVDPQGAQFALVSPRR